MLRWIREIFSLELRRLMAYRWDLFVKFVLMVGIQVLAGYALWSNVFSMEGSSQIGQFSLPSLIIYYFIANTIASVISPEGGFISQDIRSGELTKYLLYPKSFMIYKMVSRWPSLLLAVCQCVIALLLVYAMWGFPTDISVTFSSFVGWLVLVHCASLVYVLIWAPFSYVAFWVENVWSIQFILIFSVNFFSGRLFPLTMLPDWVYAILKFSPFPALVNLPVMVLFNRSSMSEWIWGLGTLVVWGLVFAWFGSRVWSIGLHRYTGVGI